MNSIIVSAKVQIKKGRRGDKTREYALDEEKENVTN